MSHLIDRKIGNQVEGEVIADIFKGYVFKITGGMDKDGFSMKNGVLTTDRKRLLLRKGNKGLRFKRGIHRLGSQYRRSVRGCIVSPDIKMLALKIVKVGENVIPGLTNPEDAIPKRLAPKIANNILKEFGLLEIYNKKKQNAEEKKL